MPDGCTASAGGRDSPSRVRRPGDGSTWCRPTGASWRPTRVVPDVVADGVRRERAAGVDAEQRCRHTKLARQIVPFQEVVGEHDLAHLRLELVRLRPLPVLVPGFEIPRAIRVLEVEARREWRQLARVAAAASLREHGFSALQCGSVRIQVPVAIRAEVLQVVRVGAGEEETRHVGRLHLRGAPVRRVLFSGRDRDRRNRLAADDRAEVQQPFLAEQPDVDIHAVERAERADRIGAVFQDTRRPGGGWRREKLRQRIARRHVIVELLVVEAAAADGFLVPLLCVHQARQQLIHGVHRARVVDVIARHGRRIERPRPRDVERLVDDRVLPASPPVEPVRRKYCAHVRLRFAHAGFSGSAGGRIGFGPT